MTPSVSLVIPSYNGAHFLAGCLDSVAALDYPRERLETIVVDNASTDGTAELLARDYPWVHVLRQDENCGFAGANNIGASAAGGECVAFANNDMRLDPAWLRELVAAYAPEEGYCCVAGLILNASGERVDFADGFVNFHGMAGQIGFGEPVEHVPVEDGRELFFACGGSMLVDRHAFLELGGFDESFFAYFEDVDLGWRLWLAGHKVRLASRARSFHHHHGTGARFPMHQRVVLYERNALSMLVKNLEERNLYRFLAAALCLVSERGRLDSGTDPAEFAFGAPSAGERREVPLNSLARFHAVSAFVEALDGAFARRAEIQALRRRSDVELFALFRRPFLPVYREEAYLAAAARLVRAFGILDQFPERRATQLVVVPGADTARAVELARETSRFVRTVFAGDGAPAGTEAFADRSREELEQLVRESDVLVLGDGAPHAAELSAQARLVRSTDASGEELRGLVEAPPGLGSAATEELQVLAALWRAQPTQDGLAQSLWGRLPERVRTSLRPALRKLRGSGG